LKQVVIVAYYGGQFQNFEFGVKISLKIYRDNHMTDKDQRKTIEIKKKEAKREEREKEGDEEQVDGEEGDFIQDILDHHGVENDELANTLREAFEYKLSEMAGEVAATQNHDILTSLLSAGDEDNQVNIVDALLMLRGDLVPLVEKQTKCLLKLCTILQESHKQPST
jgi:hypothetical protein